MPFRIVRLALGLLVLLAPGIALAQPAFLVKDINTAAPQHRSTIETGRRIAALGGVFLFEVDDGGTTGSELWRSDGTLAGTSLVKDICPGSCSSMPQSFTVSNGALFFTADDGAHGRELWKSDGTPEGTSMVADVQPGRSLWLGDLVDAGGQLFFTADDGVHGLELWVSDGTAAGTRLVKDIEPGGNGIVLRFLATSGPRLLFTAGHGTSFGEPWVSDGTAAGTVQVAQIRNDPVDAVSLNYDPLVSGVDAAPAPQGGFLFAADDGTGTALWYTDGTAGGTTVRISNAASPHGMAVFQGAVYFAASDPAAGVELWKSDGTAAGTARLKDLQPGGSGSDPRELTVAGNRLYFHAKTTLYGAELWKTDGTTLGTVGVTALNPDSGDAFPITPGLPNRYQLSALGNNLIFFARDPSTLELWQTDGINTMKLTAAGMPDFIPVMARGLQTAGGSALFLAGNWGTEIWASDGTPAGTHRLLDAATSTSAIQFPYNTRLPPHTFGALGNRLLFPAVDNTLPYSLPWITDGTAAGTSWINTVGDLGPVFVRSLEDDGAVFLTNQGIWSSDGTPGGTRSLGSGSFYAGGLPALGGALFFESFNGPSAELWKTDGTPAGTVLATPLPVPFNGEMLASGGKLFMPGYQPNQATLLVTDGTPAGTVHISGLGQGGGELSQIYKLVDVGGTVYFTARDSFTWELWKTDGTAAGTVRIKAVQDSYYTSFFNLVGGEAAAPAGGPLFLVMSDDEAGAELWKSDGTTAGTVRLTDLRPGPLGSIPHALTPIGDKLYFVADDGVHGDEVWVSDGTAAGTRMVADVLPGPDSSRPDNLTAVGGTLLFSAWDGVHGVEPWRTSGTAAGTRMIQDVAPGPLSSSPLQFTAAGPNVYFAADDNTTGFELWAVPQVSALSSFVDVPTDYWAWRSVEAVAAAGITLGCGFNQYCPDRTLTRAEMGVLLGRGLHGSAFVPPPATGTRFNDVPASYWAADWIEQIAMDGLTQGCSASPPLYCPGAPVPRSEMAVFLLRARHGGSYVPPPATGTRFADVPASYWAAPWIEQLAAEGITNGCDVNLYCPTRTVNRAEMAVFLARSFNLPLP